jgi:SAM-dependent methyltransferase
VQNLLAGVPKVRPTSVGLRNFTTNVPLAWTYAAMRTVTPGGGWRLEAFGYCASCDRNAMFVLAKRHAAWVDRISTAWDNSDTYKRALAMRESSICSLCRANLRMRAQARTVLDVLGLARTRDFAKMLESNRRFATFEAATNTVFRTRRVVGRPNYVSSEYNEEAPRGAIVNGTLNQDLQCLTFDDASFDIVLTSDVLEHVAELDRSLSEIRRVLKPGGHHVFTIPVDPELPRTIERAHLKGSTVVYDLPPVYHGDSMRGDGILAFRDFGADAAERLSHPSMPCRVVRCAMPHGYTTAVFVARKS